MAKNKVVLPKEVAEAIEELKEIGITNYGIVTHVDRGTRLGSTGLKPSVTIIRNYFFGDGVRTDTLLQALVNGYEVEQTPEDKLRKFFHTKPNRMHPDTVLYNSGAKHGVKKTLSILGITIEGINDTISKGCE